MYLVLGSCRTCTIMYNSKLDCLNTWKEVGKRGENKCIIGRVWTINEHFEILNLILNKKSPSDYIGMEFEKYSDIENNINFIRKNFSKIKGIIMEVSSIKYYTHKINNKLIHNVIHSKKENKFNENILQENEIDSYINKIINLVPDKNIIFINHLLHELIPNRRLIHKCLNKINSKNSLVITPSEMWKNSNPDNYLADQEHYKPEMFYKITQFFDDKITSKFK